MTHDDYVRLEALEAQMKQLRTAIIDIEETLSTFEDPNLQCVIDDGYPFSESFDENGAVIDWIDSTVLRCITERNKHLEVSR